VDFAAPGHAGANAPTHEGADPPDEIVNGRIDLGALTAEFLALGLDPYPRKPGVSFDETAASDRSDSPFAGLERLRRDE